MAIRFVMKTGNDANGGTSPADAFLTLGAAAAVAAAGDFIIVGAGVYYELLTLVTSGSSGSRISWIADWEGELTGVKGLVVVTASNSDDRTETRTACIDLAGKDFNTFDGFQLYGGSTAVVRTATVASATYFRRCHLQHVLTSSNRSLFEVTGAVAACFDDMIVENCVLRPNLATNGSCFNAQSTTLASNGAPLRIRNNLIMAVDSTTGAGNSMIFRGTSVTASDVHVTNNIILGTGQWSTVSRMVEFPISTTRTICSNNIIYDPQVTVTAAIATNAATAAGNVFKLPFLNFLHEGLISTLGAGSPVDQGGSTAGYFASDDGVPVRFTTAGIEGRPRPGNTAYDAGPVEYQPAVEKETTVVDAGSAAMQLNNATTKYMWVPVDSGVAITVTFKMRKNGTYTGTQPGARLFGTMITTQTGAMTSGSGTFDTITLGPVTPSASGLALIEFRTYSVAPGSEVYVDSVTVT